MVIMVSSYYYLSDVRKGLLQEHNDKCCNLVKLLSIVKSGKKCALLLSAKTCAGNFT